MSTPARSDWRAGTRERVARVPIDGISLDVALLAARLGAVTDWAIHEPALWSLPEGSIMASGASSVATTAITIPPRTESAKVVPHGDVADEDAYVRPLAGISREDVAIAGGKGANPGELTAAGFPVPPGFVVTARAYLRFSDRARVGGLASRPPGPGRESGHGERPRSRSGFRRRRGAAARWRCARRQDDFS